MEIRATQEYAKFYFVVKPGGSPSDIEFEGQDTINVNPYLLEMFYGFDVMEIPNAIAYQEHNGSIIPLNWSPAFVNQGNGKVSFNTGTCDATKNLIIHRWSHRWDQMDRQAKLNIRIFPNPAKDAFNIDLSNLSSESVSIEIYDNQGRLLNNFNSADSMVTVNTTSYIKGIYIVRIKTTENTITKKILID